MLEDHGPWNMKSQSKAALVLEGMGRTHSESFMQRDEYLNPRRSVSMPAQICSYPSQGSVRLLRCADEDVRLQEYWKQSPALCAWWPSPCLLSVQGFQTWSDRWHTDEAFVDLPVRDSTLFQPVAVCLCEEGLSVEQ
ncbi:hypothetical protein JZ751_024921, partial [Albula glossodonta]